jgi:Sulfatase
MWNTQKVWERGLLQLFVLFAIFLLTAMAAKAQQTTGVPGSPSATTTIDGKYVPNPAPPFGGVINLSATDSKPAWPPTVVPPKGAPNVLLIMTDDQGYGITSTFGGVIPAPAMDRLAKSGLRYTQFHPPRCARRHARRSSPAVTTTRSALASSRNNPRGTPAMIRSSKRTVPPLARS